MRLTKEIRVRIYSKLIANRFNKKKSDLLKERQDFSMEAYKSLFPQWKKMNRLPKGWMHETAGFSVRINGRRKYLDFLKPVRVPDTYNDLSLTHEFYGKDEELTKKEESLQSDISETKTYINSVLNSVQTTNGLRKVWPEIDELIPKDEIKAVTMALAVPMKKLNKMLNLGGNCDSI